jgi:hypothetical protein
MDEVLALERRGRGFGVEPESLGGGAHLAASGPAVGCEAAQDPEVETPLRLGETGATGRLQLGGRDLRSRERRGNGWGHRAEVGVFGVKAHLAASVSASRTHRSSGCSATPCALR